MIGNFLKKIVGTKNERELKRLQPNVDRINALESSITALSDSALKQKTVELRSNLSQGKTVDDILP